MRILLIISFFIVSNGLWSSQFKSFMGWYTENLICDVPYKFFPDKEKRIVMQIGDLIREGVRKEVAVSYIDSKKDFRMRTYVRGIVEITDSEIIVDVNNYREITIDRFTGEIFTFIDSLKRTCKSVEGLKADRAVRELEEITKELGQKGQEKLKERKF
tara:strand:- start:58 stop:531 length:474 start_codon:yes stop_codon:yes gene_type:complete